MDDPAISAVQSILLSNHTVDALNETCYLFVKDFHKVAIKNTDLFNKCVIYPNISHDIDANILNDSLSNQLGAALGIFRGQSNFVQSITVGVAAYLKKICSLVQCDNGNATATCSNVLLNSTTLSSDDVTSCTNEVCKHLVQLLTDNPDIGGVGVYVSYIGQILMAVFIACYIIMTFARSRRKHEDIRTSQSFVDACENFQRTQCWFISALVVAAFVSLKHGVSVVDLYLLLSVTLNGVTLLSFTLLSLVYFGRKSIYTLVLTILSYILCSVFFFYSLDSRIQKHYDLVPAWDLCWRIAEMLPHSTATLRFIVDTAGLPTALFALSWCFCTIVMIATMVTYGPLNWIPLSLREWWNKSRTPLGILLGATIAILYLLVLALELYLLGLFFGIVDKHSWQFGQIVAATVWLPVIVDYVDNRMFTFSKVTQVEENMTEKPYGKNPNSEVHTQPTNQYGSLPDTPSLPHDVPHTPGTSYDPAHSPTSNGHDAKYNSYDSYHGAVEPGMSV